MSSICMLLRLNKQKFGQAIRKLLNVNLKLQKLALRLKNVFTEQRQERFTKTVAFSLIVYLFKYFFQPFMVCPLGYVKCILQHMIGRIQLPNTPLYPIGANDDYAKVTKSSAKQKWRKYVRDPNEPKAVPCDNLLAAIDEAGNEFFDQFMAIVKYGLAANGFFPEHLDSKKFLGDAAIGYYKTLLNTDKQSQMRILKNCEKAQVDEFISEMIEAFMNKAQLLEQGDYLTLVDEILSMDELNVLDFQSTKGLKETAKSKKDHGLMAITSMMNKWGLKYLLQQETQQSNLIDI